MHFHSCACQTKDSFSAESEYEHGLPNRRNHQLLQTVSCWSFVTCLSNWFEDRSLFPPKGLLPLLGVVDSEHKRSLLIAWSWLVKVIITRSWDELLVFKSIVHCCEDTVLVSLYLCPYVSIPSLFLPYTECKLLRIKIAFLSTVPCRVDFCFVRRVSKYHSI